MKTTFIYFVWKWLFFHSTNAERLSNKHIIGLTPPLQNKDVSFTSYTCDSTMFPFNIAFKQSQKQ